MSSKSLRRLASEHRSLHKSPLPPNYLFPPSSAGSSIPDDLSQLSVLLAGPQGTPYAQGLWKLHLKFPDDYPNSPPKAAFRTRIWHPNVEEETGSVCVDTLKKDWKSELTIRDVLVTISCLLIYPNPDSALNASAGQLLQEDYAAFAGQAKLMTSIHAVPASSLRGLVLEAKRRGNDNKDHPEEREEGTRRTEKAAVASSVVMKSKPTTASIIPPPATAAQQYTLDDAESEEEDEASASKENDPSLSPSPVTPAPESPRKNIFGKRPLSDLPTPVDPDAADSEDEYDDRVSFSQKNIANNTSDPQSSTAPAPPTTTTGGSRKSPKLAERGPGINSFGRIRDDAEPSGSAAPVFADHHHPPSISSSQPPPDKTTPTPMPTDVAAAAEGKENIVSAGLAAASNKPGQLSRKAGLSAGVAPRPVAGRQVSTASSASSASGKGGKLRVGLRRL